MRRRELDRLDTLHETVFVRLVLREDHEEAIGVRALLPEPVEIRLLENAVKVADRLMIVQDEAKLKRIHSGARPWEIRMEDGFVIGNLFDA